MCVCVGVSEGERRGAGADPRNVGYMRAKISLVRPSTSTRTILYDVKLSVGICAHNMLGLCR